MWLPVRYTCSVTWMDIIILFRTMVCNDPSEAFPVVIGMFLPLYNVIARLVGMLLISCHDEPTNDSTSTYPYYRVCGCQTKCSKIEPRAIILKRLRSIMKTLHENTRVRFRCVVQNYV